MAKAAPVTKAARPPARTGSARTEQLATLSLKACLIARDAAFNLRDLLTQSSRMAFLAIKECEKELDMIEREIDERLPVAISRVGEARARQLLSSLKCITDLERIGDLTMSVAHRVHARTNRIPAADAKALSEMAVKLHDMLDVIYGGFVNLDLEAARRVLQMDKEIDRNCHDIFQKYLARTQNEVASFDILLMAQALERAGDHTTNLAEELYSLIEGRSLRHAPKKTASQ